MKMILEVLQQGQEEDEEERVTHVSEVPELSYAQESSIVPYYFHQAFPLYRLLLLPYFLEVWKQPPPPSTNDVLRDLLPTIFSYADAETLSRSAQVCRQWRDATETNGFLRWEHLCRVTFGVSANQIDPPPHPKNLYIMVHQQWKQLYRMATTTTARGAQPFGTNLTSLPTIAISNMR